MTTVIMRTTARAIVPIILVVAISLFFEGQPPRRRVHRRRPHRDGLRDRLHGLRAGLPRAGSPRPRCRSRKGPSRDRVVVAYRRLFAYGFAIAVASGLAPLLFGRSFLTQTFVMLEGVPIYDHLEVASALAFDFGVYCVVVGGLLTILSVVGAE